MIPQALGAFLAFLGVVAPGICFELQRERHRLGVTGWTFRDISVVGLVGFALTGVSVVLTFAVGRWLFGAARVLDPKAWTQQGGRYFSDNLYPVVITIGAVFAVSLLLALLLAFALGRLGSRKEGSLAKHSLWHQAFHGDVPAGSTPRIHLELTDGSAFYGYRRASTAGEDVDNREVTLTGPKLKHRPPPDATGAARTTTVIGGEWDFVIVRSSEIRYLRVQYLDRETGEHVAWPKRAAKAARPEPEAAV